MPKFITKNWIEVHDQYEGTYNINKQIRFKTSMLQSDLCNYVDTSIVVKGKITVETERNRAIDGNNRNFILKNNAPFINCMSKINNLSIENAENLDNVMPMYNLIEFSKNYSKTSGALWN